jgi:hypothetical protein
MVQQDPERLEYPADQLRLSVQQFDQRQANQHRSMNKGGR